MRFIANPDQIAEKYGPVKVTRTRFVQLEDVRISCWAATGFAGIVGCDEKLLHRVMVELSHSSQERKLVSNMEKEFSILLKPRYAMRLSFGGAVFASLVKRQWYCLRSCCFRDTNAMLSGCCFLRHLRILGTRRVQLFFPPLIWGREAPNGTVLHCMLDHTERRWIIPLATRMDGVFIAGWRIGPNRTPRSNTNLADAGAKRTSTTIAVHVGSGVQR
jgi:hypothetical protein